MIDILVMTTYVGFYSAVSHTYIFTKQANFNFLIVTYDLFFTQAGFQT